MTALVTLAGICLQVLATTDEYIIGSFPGLRQVNYLKLPDLTWRPLLAVDLVNPQAIAVDKRNARLFVVDQPALKIYWYQLITLSDGRLISDGRQHVAVEGVEAKYVAVNDVGDLYFTGKLAAIPPMTSEQSVMKQDAIALATGLTTNPVSIWSVSMSGAENARLYEPSGLALDSFNVFWGNSVEGSTRGSVVRGSNPAPEVMPETHLNPMADNVNEVYSIALTALYVFYSGPGGIYGVPKSKVGASCGTDNAECRRVSATAQTPTSMVWDGDGTVYVADNGRSKVYSFAAGAIQNDITMQPLVDANGIWGIDMLSITSAAVSATHGCRVALGLAGALAAWAMRSPW